MGKTKTESQTSLLAHLMRGLLSHTMALTNAHILNIWHASDFCARVFWGLGIPDPLHILPSQSLGVWAQAGVF